MSEVGVLNYAGYITKKHLWQDVLYVFTLILPEDSYLYDVCGSISYKDFSIFDENTPSIILYYLNYYCRYMYVGIYLKSILTFFHIYK